MKTGVNLPPSKGEYARRGLARGGRRVGGGVGGRGPDVLMSASSDGTRASLAHNYLYDPYVFPIRTLSPGLRINPTLSESLIF